VAAAAAAAADAAEMVEIGIRRIGYFIGYRFIVYPLPETSTKGTMDTES